MNGATRNEGLEGLRNPGRIIATFSSTYNDKLGFTFGTLTFLAGMLLIMVIDRLVPNPHQSLSSDDPQFRDDNRAYIRRVGLMTAIAITAHNFPEGLATFFATLESPAVSMPLAFAITKCSARYSA